MKKKKVFRFLKRALILLLCVSLVTGCLNKSKIKAQAVAIGATLGAYSLYEICLYLGCCVVAGLGIGYVVDNQDQLARMGKDFIDWSDLDDMSGWAFSSVDSTGNSYVYGTEALKEIQDTGWTVIQGGGQSPKNDDDKDGDGDKDADDRALELDEINVTATPGCLEWLSAQVGILAGKIISGDMEDNPFSEYLDLSALQESYWNGSYELDQTGAYAVVSATCIRENYNPSYGAIYVLDKYNVPRSKNPFFIAKSSSLSLWTYDGNLDVLSGLPVKVYRLDNGELLFSGTNITLAFDSGGYFSNIPVFSSTDSALAYFQKSDESGLLNKPPKVYRIADWLQENWEGAIESLNTGIRSLNDLSLVVGEAANQAMINQVNGLGYIELLNSLLAAIQALSLPDTVSDPVTYPADSTDPLPDKLPWTNPVPSPSPSPEPNPDPTNPDPSDPGGGGDIDIPQDPSGLSALFGILIILILIIIMLLTIFISCLAFIIMIFRIKATTGFLPPDMVSGLNYLKTLQIPGFGMSVYSFFMSLIYIILIFSVIGYLRKNIDKIKFPRKGK